MPFLLERTSDRPTTEFQTLAELYLKMSQGSLSFWGKQLTLLVASDKNWALKRKSEFWKTCIHHAEPDSFPILKNIADEISSDALKCDCLILYNKICQIWNISITHWMVFLLYLCFLLCYFPIELRSYFYVF